LIDPRSREDACVAIRHFAEADRSAVVALSLRAWAPVFASLAELLGPELFSRLHADWRSDQRHAVEQALSSESLRVWVADEGSVVGFVAVSFDRDRLMGEIYMIAVDPGAQNRGVGGALTEFAVEEMRRAGMRVAMIDTGGDPGHAPARRTYERSGFTQLPVARYFKAL
jgi:ribosomal protein S18 acetylase RimI-like enzyme